MDRVSQENSGIVTLNRTQTQHKKDYQKYFNNYGTTINEKADTVSKVHTYSRAKTILISAYFVAGFLMALFIANFIIISSMNNNLQASNDIYTQLVAQNEEYVSAIQEAQNADTVEARLVEAGFVTGVASTYDYLSEYTINQDAEVQVQANWYDRIVDFVTQIFGGR